MAIDRETLVVNEWELAMHAIVVGLAVVAIVVYVIGRQLVGEPLRGKRLIVLPAVLIVIGAVDLHSTHRAVQPVDIACLLVSGLIAAAIGLAQGRIMRLESRDGYLWAQLPVKGLWLWLGLVFSRLAMTAVALGVHAHVASSSSTVLLMLGINRLSQAAIVAPRVVAAGIPFAPEKDGATFLGGLFPTQPDDAGPARQGHDRDGCSVAARRVEKRLAHRAR